MLLNILQCTGHPPTPAMYSYLAPVSIVLRLKKILLHLNQPQFFSSEGKTEILAIVLIAWSCHVSRIK